VTTLSGDIRDLDSLRAAADDGYDAVCHFAGLTSTRESWRDPLTYFEVNTAGTLNLLRALAERNKSIVPPALVFLSTCAVYGEPAEQPVTEDVVPAPRTPYGQSKLAAEHLVAAQARTGAIGATILRTFNAAGAVDGITDPDRTRIIPKAVNVAAGRDDVLHINGDGVVVREFVHVDDLAAGVVTALEACQPGECPTYNIGSGVGASLRGIVATVEAVSGRTVRVEHRPPAAEPASLLSDSSLIRQQLGWRPTRSDLRSIVADAWHALAPNGT
jgi:UDP-glucose 4-epimerase